MRSQTKCLMSVVGALAKDETMKRSDSAPKPMIGARPREGGVGGSGRGLKQSQSIPVRHFTNRSCDTAFYTELHTKL